MARFRLSIRTLMVAVAVVGFNAAVLTRAVRIGRMEHWVAGYLTGFGLVLVTLNLVVLGLFLYFARRPDQPGATRLNSTPPLVVILSLYAVVLAVAILSVLFFTSGRF